MQGGGQNPPAFRGAAQDPGAGCRAQKVPLRQRAIAERLHDPASFGAVLGYIGIVTRQALQDLWRHAPDAFRWWQHSCADIALPDRDRFTSPPVVHDFGGETIETRSSRRAANWMPALIRR